MTENNGSTLDNNTKETNNASDSTQELLKNIHDMMVRNQLKQEKFNEEVIEKIEKLSDEQQKMTISINDNSGSVDRKQGYIEIDESKKSIDNSSFFASSNRTLTSCAILPPTGKSFVLKHEFKNILDMKEDEMMFSEKEEHFGVSWNLELTRGSENHVGFYLHCSPNPIGKWSIGAEFHVESDTIGIQNFAGGIAVFDDVNSLPIGWSHFIEWKNDEKDEYLVVEVHVKINKMTGIYKENLRNFDVSMKEFSDIALIVEGTEFYVLKLYLASHSPYFKSLFLGNFQESKKSEVKLSGIDADDLQNYLEVLYHEEAIDDSTVEGLLLVADMYDTPIVIKKCEEFLLEKSEKSLKKRLEMSIRYNLENLKIKSLAEIKTVDDIRSIVPGNVHDLETEIMATLFEKCLEFNR